MAELKAKETLEGEGRGLEWEGLDGEESEGGESGTDDEAKDGSEVSAEAEYEYIDIQEEG